MLSVVRLRQDLAGATDADGAALETVGKYLVGVLDWTFLLGPHIVLGANTVLLAYLLNRAGLVPGRKTRVGAHRRPPHLRLGNFGAIWCLRAGVWGCDDCGNPDDRLGAVSCRVANFQRIQSVTYHAVFVTPVSFTPVASSSEDHRMS